MAQRAVIFGCAGLGLSPEEKAFFREVEPWGFILFQRNCALPEQVRALTDALKELSGRDTVPLLIDQEGGRVRRLRPPTWYDAPAAAVFGALYAQDSEAGCTAARLNSELIADDLRTLGLTVDCLPVLDLRVAGGHDIIGDRAYSDAPDVVSALGRAAAEGLMARGVLPVIKHIPGHGRAECDSHLALPRVGVERGLLDHTDFVPFAALSDLPLAMTAHVIYEAVDPHRPATTSPTVIEQVVRGQIGFDGVLMSDDLSMRALEGAYQARAAQARAAGCDVVLHCNGDMAEMQAVAEGAGVLEGEALARARQAEQKLAACATAAAAQSFDRAATAARLTELLAGLNPTQV